MKHMASFGVVLRKDDKSKKKHKESFVDDDLPPVHKAAATGNIEQMVKDIQGDPSLLEEHSPEGLTPLGQAVLSQQLDSVKRLIKMGANIDAQDNVGRTCLSIAAYQGWHDGVMFLLRNGAKQNICDKSGRFPLHAATYHSDISTMTLLLNGLSTKDVNLPDHELMTAVHWAAFHDRPDHLMLLIQRGGDVLAKDIDGKLPLHWATQNCSFQCTHRLTSLTEGLATVNNVDFSGKSPVHYAAASGAANILKILARCENINLEQEDPEERTPLHWAAAMGHAQAVDTLLRLGVNPYPTDVDGCTPLDYALQTGNYDCVRVMEVHLGSRAIKKHKDRFLASLQGRPLKGDSGDLRYRYNRGQTPGDSQSNEDDDEVQDVPRIKVQPPTTTISKTTTNRTVLNQRGYSTSTDTDAGALTPPDTPRTAKDVNYQEPPTSRRPKIYSQRSEGAVAKLIGSTFMAAAQATILQKPPDADVTKPKTIPTRHSAPYADTPDFPTGDDSSEHWAIAAETYLPDLADSPPREESKPKIMTSTNTPELNRVSVQSFRSIPPISSNVERQPSGGDKTRHMNGLKLKGAKLTPLPSIPVNETNTESSPLGKSSSLRQDQRNQTSINMQLAPLRVPSRLNNHDAPPVSTRQEQLPLDFMTENVAETRILNRRWRDTMNRLLDRAEAANYVPLSVNKDKINKTGIKPSTNKAHSGQNPGHDSTTPGFVKHSRIPSTRLGTHVKSAPKGEQGEVSSHPPPLLTIPERGQKSTSTMCSMDISPNHDKYIQAEDEHAPSLPTPLSQRRREARQGQTSKHLKRAKHKPPSINNTKDPKDSTHNHTTKNIARRSEPTVIASSNVVESNTVSIQSILGTDKSRGGARHDRKAQVVHQVAFH